MTRIAQRMFSRLPLADHLSNMAQMKFHIFATCAHEHKDVVVQTIAAVLRAWHTVTNAVTQQNYTKQTVNYQTHSTKEKNT